jgi:hypothetical protein
MKPKPFWLLNHFTVPSIITITSDRRVLTRMPFRASRGMFEFWENHQSDAERAARPNRSGRSSIFTT